MFKAIEKNVESFTIDYLSVLNSTNEPQISLTFPSLKILKIREMERKIFEQTFCYCENLVELHLLEGYYSLGSKGTRILLSILQNNKKLKRLHLSSNIFNQIFHQKISENLSFELKSFSLKNVHKASLSDNVQLNFFYFLLSQLEHLESVNFEWLGAEILKLLLRMPKLKNVKLKGIHYERANIPWGQLNTEPRDNLINHTLGL